MGRHSTPWEKLGHEMAWWKTPSTLNKVRIQSVYLEKNWIDSVAVGTTGKLAPFPTLRSLMDTRPMAVIGIPARHGLAAR